MKAKWARTIATAGLVCAALALSGCWLSGRLDTKDIQIVPPRPEAEVTATPGGATDTDIVIGTELVTVPDVLGKYYDEAATALTAAGLEAVEVSVHGPIDEDAGEIGLIYRQTPKAGEKVPKGTKVELRYWWESQ
jgi:beta-lactam-binding protein with PASTA domain